MNQLLRFLILFDHPDVLQPSDSLVPVLGARYLASAVVMAAPLCRAGTKERVIVTKMNEILAFVSFCLTVLRRVLFCVSNLATIVFRSNVSVSFLLDCFEYRLDWGHILPAGCEECSTLPLEHLYLSPR